MREIPKFIIVYTVNKQNWISDFRKQTFVWWDALRKCVWGHKRQWNICCSICDYFGQTLMTDARRFQLRASIFEI